jgi:hypothetical protein
MGVAEGLRVSFGTNFDGHLIVRCLKSMTIFWRRIMKLPPLRLGSPPIDPPERVLTDRNAERTPLEGYNSFQDLLIRIVERTTQSPDSPVSTQELKRLADIINTEMTARLFDAVGDYDEGSETAQTAGHWIDVPPLARPEGRSPSCGQNGAHEEQGPMQSPSAIDRVVRRASESYGVNPALIKAVIRAESDFDPHATSDKGAMGLMQLMPETAEELGVSDPYDSEENIMAGTRYLKTLLNRYQGNIPLALAGYNWGMGNVEKHPEKMPAETRTYIARVNDYYREETT